MTRLLAFLASRPTENGTAIGAITSPVWLPAVSDVSRIAAEILPIVGVVWIVIQMIYFFKDHNRHE